MADLERIGISLQKQLLAKFDKLISQQGYQSRSEAIRDLIRRQLSAEHLKNPDIQAVAAVVIVYDHHATRLSEKLVALQHSHLLEVISSLHVHLDEHDCLEVIVLRGRMAQINQVGHAMLSIKGVKLGRINLVAPQCV